MLDGRTALDLRQLGAAASDFAAGAQLGGAIVIALDRAYVRARDGALVTYAGPTGDLVTTNADDDVTTDSDVFVTYEAESV
jgi:hypothetical protein